MADYQAVAAYIGVLFVVFVAGVLWLRYRVQIKRKLNLKAYNDSHPPDKDDQGKGVEQSGHVHAASR